ncbi:MAG TPA: ornithine carbamoyltransferase [Anaerolineales bacterium]|nr:ornithine carbamoyltransferase [Anaerolineales bacterium]
MKNFLDIADHTPDELEELIGLALELKKQYKSGGNPPLLAGKALAMVFQKPSLRTRVSFEMAMQHLGGHALYMSPFEIGLGQRESVADVARVLAGYVDAIMARVFDHAHVVGLAEWAGVPVINGLSDASHPCQAMADALTIWEAFGGLRGLKISYLGDGNNVSTSLMQIAAALGAHFTIAHPEGYGMQDEIVAAAAAVAESNGGRVETLQDPHAAAENADVLYTDTWTSMGQEQEAEIRRGVFPPYQVNAALLSRAKSRAIVLHCLPAHRGEEITDEVADGPQSRLFPQAENRLHAQKAILARLLRAT